MLNHTPVIRTDDMLIRTLLDAPDVPCRSPQLGDLWHCDDLTDQQAEWLCRHCPIREACLEQALRQEQQTGQRYGVRGGLTARARGELAARLDQTPVGRLLHKPTWRIGEVLAFLAEQGRAISRQTWWDKVNRGYAPAPLTARRNSGCEWDASAVKAWLTHDQSKL